VRQKPQGSFGEEDRSHSRGIPRAAPRGFAVHDGQVIGRRQLTRTIPPGSPATRRDLLGVGKNAASDKPHHSGGMRIRLSLRSSSGPCLDGRAPVAALNRPQFHLRAPGLHGEAVLVGGVVQVPWAVVTVCDEQLFLVTHLVAGVQAVHDVCGPGGPRQRRRGRRTDPARPEPGAELKPGHRVGGARHLPVVSPADDVAADGCGVGRSCSAQEAQPDLTVRIVDICVRRPPLRQPRR
jgi:hypothetical protein